MARLLNHPQVKPLLSDEHFSVDGTLIEAWASQKSFRPKDGSGDDDDGGNFHGQKRKNDTHASASDPDSRLYRKAAGREAKLCYMGHATMENRHGLAVAGMVTHANGTAERRASEIMLKARRKAASHRITAGEDKAYDTADHGGGVRCAPSPIPRMIPALPARKAWRRGCPRISIHGVRRSNDHPFPRRVFPGRTSWRPTMRKLLTFLIALAAIVFAVGSPASAQVGGLGFFRGQGWGISFGGSCSGWTPATPSGLVGWYNADSANVSPNTNGATVTTLTDLSSLGNNMAPNGFTGPTYNTTGLGGKPALVFAGSNTTGMRTTADVVSIGTGSTSSIFMLASFTSGSGGGPYIAGNGQVSGPGSSDNSWTLGAQSGTPGIEADHSFGAYGSTAAALNTELRLGFVLDGTNATAYVNNVAGTPQALSFSLTTPGTLSAASGGFAGSLREGIFYNTALGSTDRACMDAYLVSRQ